MKHKREPNVIICTGCKHMYDADQFCVCPYCGQEQYYLNS